MHPLSLSMNNNNLTFLEWEIGNVLAHGAFDGYDLVDKLVKRAQRDMSNILRKSA